MTEHTELAEVAEAVARKVNPAFALIALLSLFVTLWIGVGALLSEDVGGAMTVNYTAIGICWLIWGGLWTTVWTLFAVQHPLKGRGR